MQKKPLYSTSIKCPECGNENIITDKESGENVCGNCGLVISLIYSTGPERRVFSLEEKERRLRTGLPLTYTLHDKGLTTQIDSRNIDKYGKPFSSEQKATFYRLRKWQTRMRILKNVEPTLARGLVEIERICDKSGLPEPIYENASFILRKVVNEGVLRGRKLNNIAAACVYLACRQAKIPRSLDEIANISLSTKKEIAKEYRDIIKEMDYLLQPPSPSDYVSKLVSSLKICGKTEDITQKIIYNAKDLKITSGKDPLGIAAAATYISSILTGKRRSQREIAEIANCTEVTLRHRYRELVERLSFEVRL